MSSRCVVRRRVGKSKFSERRLEVPHHPSHTRNHANNSPMHTSAAAVLVPVHKMSSTSAKVSAVIRSSI